MAEGRLYSLDALRGFCALAVLVYHYSSWTGVPVNETLGLYAVECFFVISGYSLAIAYHEADFSRGPALRSFFIRRAFRILPLLFLATALTLHATLANVWPTFLIAPIIASPSMTTATGGWSLGVELGLYLLFPLIVSRRAALWALVAVTLFYSLVMLDASRPAGEQWAAYVALPNHVGLFAAGILLRGVPVPRWAGLIALAMFLLPVGRVGHLVACVLLVGAAASFLMEPKGWQRIPVWLGDISFGVYLLHPVVFDHFKAAGFVALPLLAGGATIALASLSYAAIERPMRRVGALLAGTSPSSEHTVRSAV